MNRFFNKTTSLLVLSGLLLIPGWYEWGTGLTLLIAFVPLLILLERSAQANLKASKIYLLSFVAMAIWNIGDTWWIHYALVDGKPSWAGILSAVIISSVLMSFPLWFSYLMRRQYGFFAGYLSFVAAWIACEFAYTHGEVSWPWLTLGNGFAYEVKLIQWYEYTGAMGGSLWVLLVNLLVYRSFFNNKSEYAFNRKIASIASAFIVFPIALSLILFYSYTEKINPRKIIVIQPNIDPYLKFNDIPSIEQTLIQVNIAEELADSTVDYVVAPETSIMNDIWIGEFDKVDDFRLIRDLISDYPRMKYVTGIMCYELYAPNDVKTSTAKEFRNGFYYDSYNSSIQIDSTSEIQLYHKSKLVVGVEKMPYPGLLKILKPLTMRLGGTFRSHNTQKEREAFFAPDKQTAVGTPICYESVYGEFVGEFVKKGATLIFVITNDGWWDDTPGHRQHNSLSSIRAIETRRSIARSANTGTSSFINQRGEVLQKLGWWKRGALVDTLNANDKITFYVRYGDYIGRASFFATIVLLVSYLVRRIRGRFKV